MDFEAQGEPQAHQKKNIYLLKNKNKTSTFPEAFSFLSVIS
jgi:hypothetical protein